jgi:hypothetical protein
VTLAACMRLDDCWQQHDWRGPKPLWPHSGSSRSYHEASLTCAEGLHLAVEQVCAGIAACLSCTCFAACIAALAAAGTLG